MTDSDKGYAELLMDMISCYGGCVSESYVFAEGIERYQAVYIGKDNKIRACEPAVLDVSDNIRRGTAGQA